VAVLLPLVIVFLVLGVFFFFFLFFLVLTDSVETCRFFWLSHRSWLVILLRVTLLVASLAKAKQFLIWLLAPIAEPGGRLGLVLNLFVILRYKTSIH